MFKALVYVHVVVYLYLWRAGFFVHMEILRIFICYLLVSSQFIFLNPPSLTHTLISLPLTHTHTHSNAAM